MKAMNIVKRIFAVIFFLLAIAAALWAVRVARYALAAEPLIPDEGPDGPTGRLEQFFGALEQRDFPAAYALLSNYSTLGLETAPADATAAAFWEAQQDVWAFTVHPGHEMNGTELTKTVTVRCLDAPAVSAEIGDRLDALLAAAAEAATEESAVYDETGEYREDLLKQSLRQATDEALAHAAEHTYEQDVTMHLKYIDGAWMIAADNALLSALTSGALR